ncbi:MAG: stage III sporulation protein AG [Ruminococcus sp.]|nr:stage III sporulation protein AG [Ruminococcus sp.]
MTEQMKKYLSKLKNSPNKLRLAVILGSVGILLIMLSEMLPAKRSADTSAETKAEDNDKSESFREDTERELKALLEQIDGVGECEVMLSVEGTTEYVYAENISRYTDENADRKSDKLDENVVLVDADGSKQALVRKIIRPQVSGVVVVCDGGGNIKVNERVLRTVSTALNISSSRVYVEAKCR